jgi:acetyl-CoA carboxylase carboxyl transferase beta subunit/acetyl-CoA carboxylase carboxyl transferase alpha subunit
VKTFRGFRLSPSPSFPQSTISAASVLANCIRCGAPLAGLPRYVRYRVCDECGYAYPISAHDRIASLVDQNSFREIESKMGSSDPLDFSDDEQYSIRLAEQHENTGQIDAAVIGTARLRGRQIVLGVLDFAFMGGSMGVVVGEKIAIAADLALKERRPLVTIVASGGARMQEGLYALLQMAKTSAAVQRLHREGIIYVSVLTHPTTGGVFASFASLGDVIIAEPGALIGFAGPRVVEQMLGKSLPPGSHTAEFLLNHGIIDDIVDRVRLRGYLADLLGMLDTATRPSVESASQLPEISIESDESPVDAWASVQTARSGDRPTTHDYIARMFDVFIELHGDRESGDDPAVIAGIGEIAGHHVAVIGFERGHGDEKRRLGRPVPSGYRKAQRVMRLAARQGLPVISLVDTPGAFPGIESEEGGLAGEIAETLALMSDLPTRTIAAIIGEGGSGGALAIAVADRVLMQRHAIFSVIAPEGAAAILYRDASRAPELAAKLKITADDCLSAGIVDTIVPEPSASAADDLDVAAHLLRRALLAGLGDLEKRSINAIVRERYQRYRSFGRMATVTRGPEHSAKARAERPSTGDENGITTGAAQ